MAFASAPFGTDPGAVCLSARLDETPDDRWIWTNKNRQRRIGGIPRSDKAGLRATSKYAAHPESWARATPSHQRGAGLITSPQHPLSRGSTPQKAAVDHPVPRGSRHAADFLSDTKQRGVASPHARGDAVTVHMHHASSVQLSFGQAPTMGSVPSSQKSINSTFGESRHQQRGRQGHHFRYHSSLTPGETGMVPKSTADIQYARSAGKGRPAAFNSSTGVGSALCHHTQREGRAGQHYRTSSGSAGQQL